MQDRPPSAAWCKLHTNRSSPVHFLIISAWTRTGTHPAGLTLPAAPHRAPPLPSPCAPAPPPPAPSAESGAGTRRQRGAQKHGRAPPGQEGAVAVEPGRAPPPFRSARRGPEAGPAPAAAPLRAQEPDPEPLGSARRWRPCPCCRRPAAASVSTTALGEARGGRDGGRGDAM